MIIIMFADDGYSQTDVRRWKVTLTQILLRAVNDPHNIRMFPIPDINSGIIVVQKVMTYRATNSMFLK
jgi:hypothetical protein